jgi:hypothetical protein
MIIEIIAIFIIAIVIGFFIGKVIYKTVKRINNLKLQNDLVKVILGKKKNNYTMETGKIVNINTFKVKKDEGIDEIININNFIEEDKNIEDKEIKTHLPSDNYTKDKKKHNIFNIFKKRRNFGGAKTDELRRG